MSANGRFSLFSLAFAVVVVCLFVCFHFSNKRDILDFSVMAVGDIEALGSENLIKIIRGIFQVWENAQT